jgi:hypothetical protein
MLSMTLVLTRLLCSDSRRLIGVFLSAFLVGVGVLSYFVSARQGERRIILRKEVMQPQVPYAKRPASVATAGHMHWQFEKAAMSVAPAIPHEITEPLHPTKAPEDTSNGVVTDVETCDIETSQPSSNPPATAEVTSIGDDRANETQGSDQPSSDAQQPAPTNDAIGSSDQSAQPKTALPVWVASPPQSVEGFEATVISSSAELNSLAARHDLEVRLQEACQLATSNYLRNISAPVSHVRVTSDIVAGAKRESFQEIKETSQGSATVMHALLVFDDDFAEATNKAIPLALKEVRQRQVKERLHVTGLLSAMTFMALSLVHGVFNLRYHRAERKHKMTN